MGVKEYLSNRVATANDAQLVAILYEGLIEVLSDAETAMVQENQQAVILGIDKGRDILAELISTLEGDTEIANNLRSLYLYVNQLMTESINHQNPLKLEEARSVLKPLYEGWSQLGESLQVDKKIDQSPAIVSGLTYGKGQLTDHVVNQGDRWKKG